MNEKDVIGILALFKAAYPNSYKDLKKQALQGIISVWTSQLADVPPVIGSLATHKLISICKFPPSIAEFREMVAKIKLEAKDAVIMRMHRLDADTPETEYEMQARQICDMTERFKAEPSLYNLMQNDSVKKAVENPDTSSLLRLSKHYDDQ